MFRTVQNVKSELFQPSYVLVATADVSCDVVDILLLDHKQQLMLHLHHLSILIPQHPKQLHQLVEANRVFCRPAS